MRFRVHNEPDIHVTMGASNVGDSVLLGVGRIGVLCQNPRLPPVGLLPTPNESRLKRREHE